MRSNSDPMFLTKTRHYFLSIMFVPVCLMHAEASGTHSFWQGLPWNLTHWNDPTATKISWNYLWPGVTLFDARKHVTLHWQGALQCLQQQMWSLWVAGSRPITHLESPGGEADSTTHPASSSLIAVPTRSGLITEPRQELLHCKCVNTELRKHLQTAQMFIRKWQS